MTIINDIKAYDSLEFEGMDKHVFKLFLQTRNDIMVNTSKRIQIVVIRTFDLFLQLTRRRLTTIALSHPSFTLICEEYIGALLDDSVFNLDARQKLQYMYMFRHLLKEITKKKPSCKIPKEFFQKSRNLDSFKESCINKYAFVTIDRKIASELSGWSFENRVGQIFHLPLFPMAKRLGFDFTNKFATAVGEYITSRRSGAIPELKRFSKYIADYPVNITSSDFQKTIFITKFFREFFKHSFLTQCDEGADPDYVLRSWRSRFVVLMEEHVFPNKVMAEPFGTLPKPYVKTSHKRTKVKTQADGSYVSYALLTDVPIELTDEQAFKLLSQQIYSDVSIIETWAEKKVAEIWGQYSKAKNLGQNGQVRGLTSPLKWGKDLDAFAGTEHHLWLSDVSATYNQYGHLPQSHSKHNLIQLYGNCRKAAYHLALPSKHVLLPFLTLLVIDYPILTPSFFENLELTDKHDKKIGFVKLDSGKYILDGGKARKGANKGQQSVIISGRGVELVKKLIELTSPARAFLKGIGDDNYRRFLLTTGIAFGYPRKPALPHFTGTTALSSLSNDFQKKTSIDADRADKLAMRFSLRTLRASAGVLVYLKTQSVKKMSEALGHSKYQPDLLDKYLPESIQLFFRDRWIRVFQTGIIVEALKDSDFLLDASGFKTMNQVHEFLENHAIKLIPKYYEPLDDDGEQMVNRLSLNEIVFEVSLPILTLLLSIKKCVEESVFPDYGIPQYWAQVANRLIEHIAISMAHRADVQQCLSEAMEKASSSLIKGISYE